MTTSRARKPSSAASSHAPDQQLITSVRSRVGWSRRRSQGARAVRRARAGSACALTSSWSVAARVRAARRAAGGRSSLGVPSRVAEPARAVLRRGALVGPAGHRGADFQQRVVQQPELAVGGRAAVRLEAVEWPPACAGERRGRRVMGLPLVCVNPGGRLRPRCHPRDLHPPRAQRPGGPGAGLRRRRAQRGRRPRRGDWASPGRRARHGRGALHPGRAQLTFERLFADLGRIGGVETPLKVARRVAAGAALVLRIGPARTTLSPQEILAASSSGPTGPPRPGATWAGRRARTRARSRPR